MADLSLSSKILRECLDLIGCICFMSAALIGQHWVIAGIWGFMGVVQIAFLANLLMK